MKRKLSVFIAICLVLAFFSPAPSQQDRSQNVWRFLGNMVQSAAPAVAADVNLALGKPAQQSSTGWGGDPRRAVDGNPDGNYGANSVSHTENQAQAWWQVDLGAVQGIRNIRIWNRTDCCGERLAKFFVLVSENPFSPGDLNTVLRQPGVESFYHEGVTGRMTDLNVNRNGRYVRVQLSGSNYLQLAEVEVFGGAGQASSVPQGGGNVNLALGKPAQQSSTGWGGDPRRAVDGNPDGNYGANSVSHTEGQAQPWWQVDLGSVQGIRNIRIWNRTDYYGEHLAKFYVFVSDNPFPPGDINSVLSQPGVWNYYHDATAGRTTDINVNRNGRYVRAQLSGSDYLQLAEVEVFGGVGQVSSTYILPVSVAIPAVSGQQTGRSYTSAIPRPVSGPVDLTGRWRGNDGGAYFLRQVGNQVWWYGQSGDGGGSWTNVFHGRIEGNQVLGSWTDVPHGRIMNSGEMSLQIVAPNLLRAVNRTGGFGGSEWSR